MTSLARSPRAREQEQDGVVAAAARRRAVRRGECPLDLLGRQHHGQACLLVRPDPWNGAGQIACHHAAEHHEAEERAQANAQQPGRL